MKPCNICGGTEFIAKSKKCVTCFRGQEKARHKRAYVPIAKRVPEMRHPLTIRLPGELHTALLQLSIMERRSMSCQIEVMLGKALKSTV